MHDLAYHERRFTAMAGIVVGYVSDENAKWWTRSVRKLLLMGSLYDDRAMEIPIGPDQAISFNAYTPIKPFLRPLADLVISADKMAFRPRAQRVQEAMRDLDIAGRVANLFPNAVGRAYEKYLWATGELDIAGYLEMPAANAINRAAEQVMATV